jgi:hypothetical protein
MNSNPEYIGPGYWASWHIKSLQATNKDRKSEIARNIAIDIAYFPCLKCRNHAKEYIKGNPLMPAVRSNDPLSLFKWTVNFHNSVNLRLGKPMINWQKAEKLWSGESVCLEDCGMEEEKKEDDIIIKTY